MKKIISLIPFLLISAIIVYTWIVFIASEYIAEWRHYVGLILILLNAGLYFIDYKKAMLLTGIILILGTVNLLCFFVPIETFSIRIWVLNTPDLQWKPFLLFIAYGAINFNLLVDWYWDMKDGQITK